MMGNTNPDSVANRSPDSFHMRSGDAAHQHVNQVKIDLGGHTLFVMAVMTLIIAACGVVMGLNLSRQQTLQASYDNLDRQYRMTELKLDDWTVVAHRSGLQLPGDYTRGPQGNLDADSFNKRSK